jgi:hypothetical protein
LRKEKRVPAVGNANPSQIKITFEIGPMIRTIKPSSNRCLHCGGSGETVCSNVLGELGVFDCSQEYSPAFFRSLVAHTNIAACHIAAVTSGNVGNLLAIVKRIQPGRAAVTIDKVIYLLFKRTNTIRMGDRAFSLQYKPHRQ